MGVADVCGFGAIEALQNAGGRTVEIQTKDNAVANAATIVAGSVEPSIAGLDQGCRRDSITAAGVERPEGSDLASIFLYAERSASRTTVAKDSGGRAVQNSRSFDKRPRVPPVAGVLEIVQTCEASSVLSNFENYPIPGRTATLCDAVEGMVTSYNQCTDRIRTVGWKLP